MVWPLLRKCRPSCTLASTTSLQRLPASAGGGAAAATASDEAAIPYHIKLGLSVKPDVMCAVVMPFEYPL